MKIGQRLVVGHQARVVRHLGIGPADLRSQQVVQCLGSRVEHFDFKLPDPFLGRGSPVEIRPGRSLLGSQLLNGIREFVADLGFLCVEHSSRFRQSQFQVLDLSVGRSHTQWKRELESKVPAGVVGMRKASIATGIRGTPIAGEQVVTQGIDLVPADQVEPWPDQALGRLQLQREALHRPSLTPQFDTMSECLDEAGFPVRLEASSHRLIRRTKHGAVTDRQPQQPSQCRLGAIE